LLLARQSTAKAPKSWRSKTLLVFLSPLTLKVLCPHEVTLVEAAIDGSFAQQASDPECLYKQPSQ
jgi:hypothetical protein